MSTAWCVRPTATTTARRCCVSTASSKLPSIDTLAKKFVWATAGNRARVRGRRVRCACCGSDHAQCTIHDAARTSTRALSMTYAGRTPALVELERSDGWLARLGASLGFGGAKPINVQWSHAAPAAASHCPSLSTCVRSRQVTTRFACRSVIRRETARQSSRTSTYPMVVDRPLEARQSTIPPEPALALEPESGDGTARGP
jgi:hypothetical protein